MAGNRFRDICRRNTRTPWSKRLRLTFFFFVAVLSWGCAQGSLAEEVPPLVIQGANVFDVHTGKMVPNQSVIVEEGRIDAIVPSGGTLSLPTGARVIDGHGKYVIPGLIDAHAHVAHHSIRTHVAGDETLPLYIANGVTSLRSTGDPVLAEAGVAHYANSHPDTCPRLFLASPLIDGEHPYHPDNGVSITDPEKIPAFVEDMAGWNVTTLKIYVGTTRSVGQAVIREGHSHGMKVTGHLGTYSAQEAVEDGIDCLEHMLSVYNYSVPIGTPWTDKDLAEIDLANERCQALVKAIAEHNVMVDPTLAILEAIYLRDQPEIYANPDKAYMPKRLNEAWEENRKKYETEPRAPLEIRRRQVKKYKDLTGIIYRAGVTILAGTDAPEPDVCPGFSLLRELELLVESGLTPAAAIQCATINNATAVNQRDQLGSVETGKLADLVILVADPTEDIKNARKIDYVIRGGRVVQPAEILRKFEGGSGGASANLVP